MSMYPLILICDDDPVVHESLGLYLSSEGYEHQSAYDGQQALEMVESVHPDMIVLDLMMPKMSGIDVCRTIRQTSSVPIIMLTAKGEEIDRILGLELGADDYIVKPFHEQELAARIYTALRRRIPGGQGSFYQAGDLKIDFSRRQVSLAGEEIHFSPVEYRILECLALNSGTVVTYQMLLEKIWGPYASSGSRILRVNMTNIRKKIEKIPMDPTYITTIPRVGYRMLESQTASVV